MNEAELRCVFYAVGPEGFKVIIIIHLRVRKLGLLMRGCSVPIETGVGGAG